MTTNSYRPEPGPELAEWLQSLREDPRWPVLGRWLNAQIPRVEDYSPQKDADTKSERKWIYQSGVRQGERNALSRLGLLME